MPDPAWTRPWAVALVTPLLTMAAVGCGGPAPAGSTEATTERATVDAAGGEAPALPEGHPALPDESAAGDFVSFEGEVLETMDSGGYTYARIARGDGDRWVAGPVTPLAVGATVVVSGATNMGAFESASLGRTFDDLYFTAAFLDPFPEGTVEEGVVQEALSGAGYVYLRVRTEEAEMWLAGPGVEVVVGQRVAWSGGTAMGEFTSSTLGRTFDDILFVERIGIR